MEAERIPDLGGPGNPPLYATEIRAAGFNAHSQLRCDSTQDQRTLQRLSNAPDGIEILLASWSTTTLTSSDHTIWSLGHQKLACSPYVPQNEVDAEALESAESLDPVVPACAFGDHNGLLGFVDTKGKLTLVFPSLNQNEEASWNSFTRLLGNTDSPLLGLVALAGNQRVVVTRQQAPNSRLCHIEEFGDFEKFQTWYQDPSGKDNEPAAHHILLGRPRHLVANVANFFMLMEDGGVYSWGDPRHQSLGRPIMGEGMSPADKPGVIEALGGLRIKKVAAGGWVGAALSEDGALYVWGSPSMPGSDHEIRCLREAGAGEVMLVELPGESFEPLDVLDVAVGDGHIAVVTAHHKGNGLHVVGNNRNGQLGIDSEADFLEDWAEARTTGHVRRVVCGPKSTYCVVSATKPLCERPKARDICPDACPTNLRS